MHRMRALLLLLLFASPLHAANPVAGAYSAFISDLAHAITAPQREALGVELESKTVTYNGQPVTFQYQMWRLRPNSVCTQQKHNLLAYSQCSQAASALFTEICRHLNNHPSGHWKHQKFKQLYCSASVEFKPVVAEARRSEAENDVDRQKRQQCSVLRIEAMSSRDPRTIQMRDEVCGG